MARAARPTAEFAPPEPDFDDDDGGGRRKPGGRKLGVVLWLFILAFVAYLVLRVAGIEATGWLVAAMALTPYVAVFGVVLGLLCVLLRRRFVGVVVLLLALALGVLLVPRVMSEEQPAVHGQRLRIMSVNLRLGHADARTIMKIARAQRVDVLVLPELTQHEVDALNAQGMEKLLPNNVFDVGLGGEGTGIASRYPLRQIALMGETTMAQPSVVVDMPDRPGDVENAEKDVELTAVHIDPGVRESEVHTWSAELARLPWPTQRERVRILAGDFNASFDHAAFRAVVDRGYADAGDETGKGMAPTWSTWPWGPPVTIDHILTDNRCAISGYSTFEVPGTDHHAIVSEVILP